MFELSEEEKQTMMDGIAAYAREHRLSRPQIIELAQNQLARRRELVRGFDVQVMDERHPDYPKPLQPWIDLVDREQLSCEFCGESVMFVDNVGGTFASSKLLVEVSPAWPFAWINSAHSRCALVQPEGRGLVLGSRFSPDQLDANFGLVDIVSASLLAESDPAARVVAVHWDHCSQSRAKRDSKSNYRSYKAQVSNAEE